MVRLANSNTAAHVGNFGCLSQSLSLVSLVIDFDATDNILSNRSLLSSLITIDNFSSITVANGSQKRPMALVLPNPF